MANRVHILEPQWNPSVESQAIGRVVRLGQTRTVHVVRYIVDGTVEIVSNYGPTPELGLANKSQNVQNGQLRKLQLAKSGFGAGKPEQIKRRAEMLKLTLHLTL